MSVISMRSVSKRYNEQFVVRDLNLEIGQGEAFVIVGASGSGKTTTLRMMNRLVEPTSGSIEVLGEDITRASPAELRRRIGYVIQEVGLFPHYTVRQNVAVVPELLGWDKKRILSRTDELLDMLDLPPDEFGARFPRELSGGQRQRVGIARALAADPPLLLLDEPFGALDPITREKVREQFARISRSLGKAFVLITHDVFEAVELGERVAVMNEGRVVQCAPPTELVETPADEFVEAMLGRHRYQLRLMTTPVRKALGAASTAPPSNGAEVIDVAEDDNVWSTLERMEESKARVVRVAEDDSPRFLTREQLLESAAGQ